MQSNLRSLTVTSRPRFGRVVAMTAIALGLTFSSAAQAAACAAASEESTLQVRVLQTQLVVAALTCNQRADYNAFVTRFQPQLSAQGKLLKAFFERKYGGGSAKAMNGFVTRIANESSRRGMMKRGLFCHEAAVIHGASKSIGPAGLPAFAQSLRFTSLHGIIPCPTKVAAK
ncbi:MAG: hypothetical protein EXR08_05405 [Alphaproteobacteria bacterium]|nr:hypothetical protein [Alphaproteobacteria bacterium]